MVKAPVFSHEYVAGWFTIMEAQFKRANIKSQSTKFYHVLSVLPVEAASVISEEVVSQENYDLLKKAVLTHYQQSKTELFEDLISKSPVVGRPSVWLRDLKRKAQCANVSSDLLRHKFLQALPSSVRIVLAGQKDLSLDQLGTLADDLISFVPSQSHNINAINNNNNNGNVIRNRNQEDNGNTTHMSVKPFYEGQRPRVCRAHVFYGEKAKTCRNWCQWPDKSKVRISQSRNASRDNSPNGRGN